MAASSLPRLRHDEIIKAARVYVKAYRSEKWEDDKFLSLHIAQFTSLYIRRWRRQARKGKR